MVQRRDTQHKKTTSGRQTAQQKVGRWGEDAAARFLERHGYTILARNVHTRYGEIDLVTRNANHRLVFVEVKARTNLSFGYPEEAVDTRKLNHLVSAAQAYLAAQSDLAENEWQIDVVAVQGRPGQRDEEIQFEHFEDVAS